MTVEAAPEVAPATWLGYPLYEDGTLRLTLGQWTEGKKRFIGFGLKLVAFTFLSRGSVRIHIVPSNGPAMSGSFVIECKGLDGTVKDVEQLGRIALAAAKSLGWGWFRVSERRTLKTAFDQVDYDCKPEGRYRMGEVDVLLEGHGVQDGVAETVKFDLGLRLRDGKVSIYGISRSRPLGTPTFASKFDRFEDAFTDLATIDQLTEGLGVDLSQVEWAEGRSKATVKVSSGFGIQ